MIPEYDEAIRMTMPPIQRPSVPDAVPDQALLELLQSTYQAANAANWDRDALECPTGWPGVVRPA